MVKYASTYSEYTIKRRTQKDLFDDDYVMFSDFLYKAYVVGTHMNCIDNAIQTSTHNIGLYKEVKKMYTDCSLKTTELLDCTLIGVCAVIRSNTVYIEKSKSKSLRKRKSQARKQRPENYESSSRKHAYIILTPSNPTFI